MPVAMKSSLAKRDNSGPRKARSLSRRCSALKPTSSKGRPRCKCGVKRFYASKSSRKLSASKRVVAAKFVKPRQCSVSLDLNDTDFVPTPPYLLGYMDEINRDFVVQKILDRRANKGTVAVVKMRADPHRRASVLKVFPKTDHKRIERRRKEADCHQEVSATRHHHISSYLGQYDYRGAFCLSMEYCERGDLNGLPAAVPQLERLDLVRQIASALSHMHDNLGMLHVDLKPSNVGLRAATNHRLVAKLIDFGSAKPAGTLRAQGGMFGATPNFKAPETFPGFNYARQRVAGKFNLGPAIDMWGLGIIAVHVITNQLPWDLAKTSDVRFKRYLDHMAVRPKGSRAKIPLEVRRNLPSIYHVHLIPGLLAPFHPSDRTPAKRLEELLTQHLRGSRGRFRNVQGVLLFEAA